MAEKSLILKSQANEIFDAIRERGLDPGEFAWAEQVSERSKGLVISVLTHRPTGYYFMFDYYQRKHYAERSPGRGAGKDWQYPGDWENQWRYVLEWLDYLKQEIEAPDLWSAISQERTLADAAAAPETSNLPFTTEEQRQISDRLSEIERYLARIQDLNAEQVQFVRQRFQYLQDAVVRMGRKDWLHTAVGVFFTVAIGLGLAPDKARELFRFASEILGSVLGLVRMLP